MIQDTGNIENDIIESTDKIDRPLLGISMLSKPIKKKELDRRKLYPIGTQCSICKFKSTAMCQICKGMCLRCYINSCNKKAREGKKERTRDARAYSRFSQGKTHKLNYFS